MFRSKEETVKREVEKLFGTDASSAEMREAVFMSRMGMVTEEVIAKYREQKAQQMELIRAKFNEVNPVYETEGVRVLSMEEIAKLNIQPYVIDERPVITNDVISERSTTDVTIDA
jgi:hypothetical protein